MLHFGYLRITVGIVGIRKHCHDVDREGADRVHHKGTMHVCLGHLPIIGDEMTFAHETCAEVEDDVDDEKQVDQRVAPIPLQVGDAISAKRDRAVGVLRICAHGLNHVRLECNLEGNGDAAIEDGDGEQQVPTGAEG